MSETKHTPGPWRLNGRNQIWATFPSKQGGDWKTTALIAEVRHNPEANAALIAAAPDLQKALYRLMAETDDVSALGQSGSCDVRLPSVEAMNEAVLALAKSEGGVIDGKAETLSNE